MAEGNGGINNQKKRRLPEWMSRTSSSNEQKQIVEDENELYQPHPVLSSETTVSVECIVKEKDLESTQKTRASHKNISDTAVGYPRKSSLKRRLPKVDSKTVHKAKKTSSTCEMDGNEEWGDLSFRGNENELELTVNDLISIAREHVKADEEAKRAKRGTQRSTSRPTSPSPSIAFRRSSNEASDITGVSKSTTVSHGSEILPETKGNNGDRLELGSASTSVLRSGDAAQDMLDVFFGSLLKKPRPENQQLETVIEDDVVWTSVDTSKHAFSQTGVSSDPFVRKPDLRDWKSETVATNVVWSSAISSKDAVIEADKGVGAIVVEKRKSSLKERVTMFLD